jgi:hypothetical protein
MWDHRQRQAHQPGDRQRQLRHHRAAAHRDKAPPSVISRFAATAMSASSAPTTHRLWLSCPTDDANPPARSPKPRTKPCPTLPLRPWRSRTQIFSRSRDASASRRPSPNCLHPTPAAFVRWPPGLPSLSGTRRLRDRCNSETIRMVQPRDVHPSRLRCRGMGAVVVMGAAAITGAEGGELMAPRARLPRR